MIGGLLSVTYLWFLDGQLEQLRGSERDQAVILMFLCLLLIVCIVKQDLPHGTTHFLFPFDF